MSSRIALLDEVTINQIAAGEVIERPASALKELIENSLDAGSTRIDIEIEEGGLSLLRVIDNGWGMTPEEIRLSVERYATSKISSVKDLFQVMSFGFRGEALASIAAVSRLEIISRPMEQQTGTRLVVEGGEVRALESVGAPLGTRITVRDLFYNVPARRKFLKSPSTELRCSIDTVSRLVLGNPEVGFSLRVPGRNIIQSNGNNLLEAIAAVYGIEVAQNLLPVGGGEKTVAEKFIEEKNRTSNEKINLQANSGRNKAQIKVEGYVSGPGFTRNNRHHQTFLVNRRYVRSKLFQQVVDEAYHSLLPAKRFPVVVLHLAIAPDMIDINVHPAKMEIRFREEDLVFENMLRALHKTLRTASVIPKFGPYNRSSKPPFFKKEMPDESFFKSTGIKTNKHKAASQSQKAFTFQPVRNITKISKHPDQKEVTLDRMDKSGEDVLKISEKRSCSYLAPNTSGDSSQHNTSLSVDREQAGYTFNTDSEMASVHSVSTDDEKKVFPELCPKAQIAGTYILAESEDGLYILDQHAVHERILYEKIMKSLKSGNNYSQNVLFPETIELSPEEKEVFTQGVLIFRNLGFILEHLEHNRFLLRGIPVFINGSGKEEFLDLIDYLRNRPYVDDKLLYEGISARLACRQAIKAADLLNQDEMENLIMQMKELNNPYTCPHGRPTIIFFSKDKLKSLFQRH